MNKNESVIKAFGIIEYLARNHEWVGLRKLARDLDIDPATALRFILSLKEMGYIKQHPENQGYQLSLKFAWLASLVLDRIQLRSIAQPEMKRLTAVTNETSHLLVLDGTEMVYLHKVDGDQAMRMTSRVGNRTHVHSTASGKALLAFLPTSERDALLAEMSLAPLTKNTITDISILSSQLDQIRKRGYSIDDEENEIGIRCVGAPILDHTGRVVGAISLSGWTITMTRERVVQLAEELKQACLAVSRELGFQPEIRYVADNNP